MATNRNKLLVFVLTALVALSFLAVCPPAMAAKKAKKIVLCQKSVTINKGESYLLWIAKVTPASIPIVPEKAKWKSSNKKVARVNAGGLVTAVKKGSATITCTYRGASATCKVKVILNVPLTGYTLDKTSLQLDEGKTATITPGGFEPANTTSKKTAVWRSSDAQIARVSAAGVVTGAAPGSANITCSIDGIERVCAVLVGDKERRFAYEVYRLVNVERRARGLAELSVYEPMMGWAKIRSRELVVRYDHIRPNGTACLTLIPYYLSVTCAENIAKGTNKLTTPADAMTAWMNSSGHRESILDPQFRVIGVGYYNVGNTHYWVQLFSAAPPK